MTEFRCKDLGFDCSFVTNEKNSKVLIGIQEHLKLVHGVAYNESFLRSIFEKDHPSLDSDLVSCNEHSCGISLEKWKIGHRNFP